MINDYFFRGQVQVIKSDGTAAQVPVPAQQILLKEGPTIPCIITHPLSVINQLTQQGKPVPPAIPVKALIDTGAFCSVIKPDIAAKLNLIQTGFKKITSVNKEEDHPAYFARLNFAWGKGKDVQVVACPLKGIFDCLIGRDILMHWHFTYNGKGYITICD